MLMGIFMRENEGIIRDLEKLTIEENGIQINNMDMEKKFF